MSGSDPDRDETQQQERCTLTSILWAGAIAVEEMPAEGWGSHQASAWLRWLKFFEGERGHILLGCTWLVTLPKPRL